ncbi:MAG: sigma-70 family RNA polymerase sigma factor [Alphaproteobacteria bacterium]|nr:MAG: sigma-70 family RNA polymerase sigma factor [Alphaproteobacteria bacterium]
MDLSAILSEHGAMLGRIVASYEADPALQQELMQEVSLTLWRALPKYNASGSLKAFVARVAQNRCISHVGKAAAAPRRAELDDEMVADSPHPEESLSREQQRQALLIAVRRLPLPLRQVTTLALEGLSHRDIADALGISENNAMVRFSRAKTLLRDLVAR